MFSAHSVANTACPSKPWRRRKRRTQQSAHPEDSPYLRVMGSVGRTVPVSRGRTTGSRLAPSVRTPPATSLSLVISSKGETFLPFLRWVQTSSRQHAPRRADVCRVDMGYWSCTRSLDFARDDMVLLMGSCHAPGELVSLEQKFRPVIAELMTEDDA